MQRKLSRSAPSAMAASAIDLLRLAKSEVLVSCIGAIRSQFCQQGNFTPPAQVVEHSPHLVQSSVCGAIGEVDFWDSLRQKLPMCSPVDMGWCHSPAASNHGNENQNGEEGEVAWNGTSEGEGIPNRTGHPGSVLFCVFYVLPDTPNTVRSH